MFTEADHPPAGTRRAPKTPAVRLRDAIHALAGGHGSIIGHREKAWASVTFEGARHTIDLRFEGSHAIEAGERLIAQLSDHEFAIPGQIVADATVTAVDHALAPAPSLSVTCELLLLKDA